LSGGSNQEGGRGHARQTRKIQLNMKFGWVNMEKRDGFEKLRADGKIILKLALRKQDEEL